MPGSSGPGSMGEHLQDRGSGWVRVMSRLSDYLNHSAALDAICEAVIEDAGAWFQADCGSVFLVSDTRHLQYVAGFGLSAQFVSRVEQTTGEEASSYFLSSANTPLMLSDLRAEPPRSPHQEFLLEEGFCALASLPLVNRGKLLGFMTLYYEDARPYSEEECDGLEMVANMLALAVANTQFTEAKQGEDRARDRFLSALSHELRTPLTSIMGFTQVIRKRLANTPNADPRLADQLEVLWTQAQRLNRLIDTFVDLSHIERGEFEINLGKVELTAILRAAVKQAVAQARTQQPVETSFSEDYIWVHGDGKRLEQIFTHVISNGLKYSPPDQPVVVSARTEQQDSRVIIDVADCGPGIPQHLRKDLFERGNPGDAQRSGGLGVGLFLARTVVEAHGGQIGVQSSPSEGTKVTIVLPV
ncbi:MAG: GAF domain-containing sensor histidine kinase [Chloroflexota bacterium]|nr:GAF domain-containing sensor histidine kinase [Chloroflexota bacterium]MDQ5866152.1 GAF domain-containing sensor histidine kinase [Chloroflexota bacterium]